MRAASRFKNSTDQSLPSQNKKHQTFNELLINLVQFCQFKKTSIIKVNVKLKNGCYYY
jgi:hypothetical protein